MINRNSKTCKNRVRIEWSSLPIYLKGESRLPYTLQWEWILSLYGDSRRIAARKYLEFIYEGIRVEKNPMEEAKGGWILGNDQWPKKVVEKWGDFSSKALKGRLTDDRKLNKQIKQILSNVKM